MAQKNTYLKTIQGIAATISHHTQKSPLIIFVNASDGDDVEKILYKLNFSPCDYTLSYAQLKETQCFNP